MGHGISGYPPNAVEYTDANGLSDPEFLAAFESGTLRADAFRHREHVRVAWIYLGAAEIDEATELMATAIRRFALHHTGTDAKFNETLTRSWMRVVARARAMTADATTFAAFAASNPMLFDRKRAFDFYGVEAS